MKTIVCTFAFLLLAGCHVDPARRQELIERLNRSAAQMQAAADQMKAAQPQSSENIKCPIDGFISVWTGTTAIDSGKLLMQYRCPTGHLFWSVN